MCVTVLLADHSDLIRRGIRSFLKINQDICVVGEASSLPEAIQKTAKLHPDVLVLDLRMAECASAEDFPLNGTKIVAISIEFGECALASAKRLGAAKFVDKMDLASELIPTLLQLGTEPNMPSTI
jgi:DNA-binding NarL/FixJ family response regulator